MLRAALGRVGGVASITAAQTAPALEFQKHFCREIRLFEIFDRSKAKERRQKLKEETSRGYWDDFKELKDTQGKLFPASSTLQPAKTATTLPDVQVLNPDGTEAGLPSIFASHSATLLCTAFRGGAEEMLASWSRPFGEEFQESPSQHVELSLVESAVMGVWPFKGMILNGKSSQAEGSFLRPRYVFHFGDADDFLKSLGLTNRLTGYAFLIDREARVRWRGCAMASPEEVDIILRCGKQLLEEDKGKPK